MDFFLFLLVNATLFIRPAEIIPALHALPIYNYLIVANLVVAFPGIINHLTESGLSRKPATACVLGVLAGIFLSHFVQFNLFSARMGAFDFAKVVAYFLILVTTVNTPRRLLILLATVASLTLAINTLAVLHYRHVIEIPSLTILMQNDYDPETGESFLIPRMQATGIFGDPNDLSMIIVAAMTICAAGLFYQPMGMPRFLLIAPIGFLGYGLTLTQSRGGLLAFFASCGTLLYSRFGGTRAILLGALTFPILLAGFGDRQTEIGAAITGGTGATRAEHWSDGLQFIKSSPIFGIGHNMYADEADGMVAHNSFVHAFAELGLVGGVPYFGLFVLLIWSLLKIRAVRDEIDHPGLRYLLPFMLALLVAYATSMMSLSRSYVVPTYLVAGLMSSYIALTQPYMSVPTIRLDGRVWSWLVLGSIAFLAIVYLYIKVLVRMT